MNTPSRIATLVLGAVVSACGSSDPERVIAQPPPAPAVPRATGALGFKTKVPIRCAEKAPDPSRTRVMVVDTGFDLRHPIFAGKVAGCYTLECPDTPSFVFRPGESDDDTAARFIAFLAAPEPSCSLREGMDLEIDEFVEGMDQPTRDAWNAAQFGKAPFGPDWNLNLVHDIERVINLSDFHGTATAGAIAYQNDVDIVAVQISLAKGPPPVTDGGASCLRQPELDRRTRILQRSDVATAYAASSLDGEERALLELRKRHGVRIENHSFGYPTTEELEGRAFWSGCGYVEYDGYVGANAALEAARLAALQERGAFDGTDILTFQSAGNHADPIDSDRDSLHCSSGRTRELLIGSYQVYRGAAVRSGFSNYGECVDAYALGSDVILPTSGGLYTVGSGTSFSSPFAARHASTFAPDASTAIALRDRVIASRDEHRFLPLSSMPVELGFYSLPVADGGTGLRPAAVEPRRTAPRRALIDPAAM
jgi:hypothetical protein